MFFEFPAPGSDDVNQVGTNNAAAATTTPSTTPTVNSSTTPDPIMEAGKRVLMAGLNKGGFPSFATLLLNYPMPYSAKPYGNLFFNQCALRVSMAMRLSGYQLQNVTNHTDPGHPSLTNKGDAMGATNLAMALSNPNVLGPPQVLNGTTTSISLALIGQTGIIFFRNFVESNNGRNMQNVHIDLWNMDGLQSNYLDQMSNSTIIWFWPIK